MSKAVYHDTKLEPPDPASMIAFFAALTPHFANKSRSFAQRMRNLFDALRDCSISVENAPQKQIDSGTIDIVALSDLFAKLRHPIKNTEEAGLFGNPWLEAGLKRDELRNARVLSWFLNPRGGHGCGDFLLTDLLCRYLPQSFPRKPSTFVP